MRVDRETVQTGMELNRLYWSKLKVKSEGEDGLLILLLIGNEKDCIFNYI
jgi:hypothetical protein